MLVQPTRTRGRSPATCAYCGVTFLALNRKLLHGTPCYCGYRCATSARQPSLRERFEDRVRHNANEHGCWSDRGNTDRDRYRPSIGIRGKTVPMTHAAWLLYRGPITDDLWVLHCCPGGENGWCINPDHLYLGDSFDNAQDVLRNGRAGWMTKPENIRRGESHYAAKLTAAQVIEIKARHAAGGVSNGALGREYGVNESAIRRIVKGQRRRQG